MLPASVQRLLGDVSESTRCVLEPAAGRKTPRDWMSKVGVGSQLQPLMMDVDDLNLASDRRASRVMPLTLVQQEARLLLVCRCEGHEDERNLALHHIPSAAPTGLKFVRPGFEMPAYDQAGGFGAGRSIRLRFALPSDIGAILQETPLATDQVSRLRTDGQFEITTKVVESASPRSSLATYDQRLVIPSPVHLSARLRRLWPRCRGSRRKEPRKHQMPRKKNPPSDYVAHANALLGDAEVQRLMSASARRQALDICTPREINISRLLGWLLDPTEGHGLGDRALRALLTVAGQKEAVGGLDAESQAFLAAHNIYSLAFSPLIVETELKANLAESNRSVDVAIIDPLNKLCIAIENKFGAREGPEQLEKYRKDLTKRFKGYTRILIFLDRLEAEPGSKAWLPVGYGWLSGFLLGEEDNASLSSDIRRTLREFREAVQDEDDESASSSSLNKMIASVAVRHQLAIQKMLEVTREGGRGLDFLDHLATLAARCKTDEGRAKLALFQLYRRRPAVWDRCGHEHRYARFTTELAKSFPDLDHEVKRVNFWYTLTAWERLVAPDQLDDYYFPAAVRVQEQGEKYKVTTYLDLRQVRPEAHAALRAMATEIRKAQGKNVPKASASGFDLYQTAGFLSAPAALREVHDRLAELQQRLAGI